MVDLILLAVMLILASFIAKLGINKSVYIILRTSIFMLVSLGILTVLNGWLGAETLINMSKGLKELGIGYPYAWQKKSVVFKDNIIGCYYLVLLGVIVMSLFACAHEHKDMKRYRDNGKNKNIMGLLLVGLFPIWMFFYVRPFSSDIISMNKVLNQIYNSEFLLLGWSLFWLALAIYYGKALRIIFNKSEIGNNHGI